MEEQSGIDPEYTRSGLLIADIDDSGQAERWSQRFEARVRGSEGRSSAERVRDIWAFYLEHWLEFPDHFRIFWAIDNEAVIGELPKELAERIPDFWKDSLEVSQKILDEGVERGEFIDCDTWQTAHTFWTVATALIEHDGIRGRRRIRQRPLKDISFGNLLLRLFQTARRFHMEVQPQLLLLQKTLLNVEGLGRELYPELDLWKTAKPFLERWMAEQIGPKRLLGEVRPVSQTEARLREAAALGFDRVFLPRFDKLQVPRGLETVAVGVSGERR